MPIEDPKSVSAIILTPLRGQEEVRHTPTPLDKSPLKEIQAMDHFDPSSQQATSSPIFSPVPLWNPPTFAGKQNNSGTDNATGGGAATPYSSASKNPTPAQPVPSVGDLHATQWLRDSKDKINPESLQELIKRAKDGDSQSVVILIELKENSNLLEQAHGAMKRHGEEEISGEEILAAVKASKNYIRNLNKYTEGLKNFPGLEILTQRDRVILLELQLAPSVELWGEFVKLIDSGRLEGQDLAEVLAYGQACIEEYWEKNPVYRSIARMAPYSWYEKAQAGQDVGLEMWGLVNGLEAKERNLGLEGLKHLLSSSLVKDLKNLDLQETGIDVEGARYLSEEISSLKNLSRLYLRENQIDAAGARALAGSVHMSGLTSLDLRNNGIGAAGASALAGSEHLSGLTSLNLRDNRIGAEGAIALAGSVHLRGLTSLNLWGNRIGDEGARALAGSMHLRGLTSLNLWGNRIGDEGARALAGSMHLRGLTSLSLTSNQIGATGAIALAGSAHLSGLTILDLGGNGIGAEGAIALAESAHLRGLTSLDLGGNLIGDEGAIALAESAHLRGLTILNLWGNRIGAEGARALAGSAHLRGLTSLNLHDNQIGATGAIALAGSVHLRGLTSLNLWRNLIGDVGAIALAGSESLSGLTSLDLGGNNHLGAEGLAALSDSPYLQNTLIETDDKTLQPGRNLPNPPAATPPQNTSNHSQALLLAAPLLEVSPFAQYGLITLGLGAGIYGAPKLLSGWDKQKPSSLWHTLHARWNDLKMSIRKPTKQRVRNKVAPKNKRHASLKISPKLAKGQALLPGNPIDLKTNQQIHGPAGLTLMTKKYFSETFLTLQLEGLQALRENPNTLSYVAELEELIKAAHRRGDFVTSTQELILQWMQEKEISKQARKAIDKFAKSMDKKIKKANKSARKLRLKGR